jgi:hypothetical protein
MNTAFLLMAQYGGGKAIIPINDVRRDYFCQLLRRVSGQLPAHIRHHRIREATRQAKQPRASQLRVFERSY